MPNGQYNDPWNPWCGYIECKHGVASRQVCASGTWMGFGEVERPAKATSGATDEAERKPIEKQEAQQPMLMSRADICRRGLRQVISNKACSAHTDYNLCFMSSFMDNNES